MSQNTSRPPFNDNGKMTRVALEATKAAQVIILEYFKKRNFEVKRKDDGSLQTSADLNAEEKLIQIIKSAFPEHGINSEESGKMASRSPYEWIIDPIDGTDNFVLGIPYFSTSISLLKEGLPVLTVVNEPITDSIYLAERNKGARLNGSDLCVSTKSRIEETSILFIPTPNSKFKAKTLSLREQLYKKCRRLLDTWAPTLDWCMVSDGRADAVVVLGNEPQGESGGTLLLTEAKGQITDFEGRPLNNNSSGCIIGSNGNALHNQLLELVTEYHEH